VYKYDEEGESHCYPLRVSTDIEDLLSVDAVALVLFEEKK
jgi:hypothetical protein